MYLKTLNCDKEAAMYLYYDAVGHQKLFWEFSAVELEWEVCYDYSQFFFVSISKPDSRDNTF